FAWWCAEYCCLCFFFSSRRRHTRWPRDWSSDVCSSDLLRPPRRLHGRRPLRRQRGARQLRAAQGGDGRERRGAHPLPAPRAAWRSEERRVGKECRSRCERGHDKKRHEEMWWTQSLVSQL